VVNIAAGFKKGIAALRAMVPKGLDSIQTGPRSMQGGGLNYGSVSTLDPARLAAAFTAADQGFITEQAKLFHLIEERDNHIYSQLNKRRLAVTALDWQLQPPDDATQSELDRTKELTDIVRNISNIAAAQFDMTDGIGKGLVALEINWEAGETWRPESLDFVPQHYFQTDRDTSELLYLKMGLPEPLKPMGWVVHEHRAKSGYIEQAALFRVLAWSYAYKAYNVKDLQRFLELYGIPLRLGKYPAGLMKEQRAELLKAVRSIGNDGAGVIPSNMAIDFIQASKMGNVDDFLKAVRYWEEKQSMAILGGDIDGQSITDTRIMVYEKVRNEIKLHDVKQLEPTYDRGLLTPISLINGLFAPDRVPKWKYSTEEPADQQALITVLETAVSMGMRVSQHWAHKELQIPQAKEGEAVLSIGSGKPTAPGAAALRAALAKVPLTQQPSIADAYVQQLIKLAVPGEQAQIEKIAALVASAGGFEEAMAAMTTLSLAPLDTNYMQVLAEAMTAANLAGRVDKL